MQKKKSNKKQRTGPYFCQKKWYENHNRSNVRSRFLRSGVFVLLERLLKRTNIHILLTKLFTAEIPFFSPVLYSGIELIVNFWLVEITRHCDMPRFDWLKNDNIFIEKLTLPCKFLEQTKRLGTFYERNAGRKFCPLGEIPGFQVRRTGCRRCLLFAGEFRVVLVFMSFIITRQFVDHLRLCLQVTMFISLAKLLIF